MQQRRRDADALALDARALVAEAAVGAEPYREFLRGPGLSVGVYLLGAGEADPQGAHDVDEVYHVLEGRARLRVAGADLDIRPDSIVYVDAGVPHSFHDIREDLKVLVVFAETPAPPADGAAPPPVG